MNGPGPVEEAEMRRYKHMEKLLKEAQELREVCHCPEFAQWHEKVEEVLKEGGR
jgi:hypothetical protein